MHNLCVAALQLPMDVGNFTGNLFRLIDHYRKAVAMGAELVVAPELFLSGYGAQDLFFHRAFRTQEEDALKDLLPHIGEVGLVLGTFTVPNPGSGDRLFNGSVLIQNKTVVMRQHKTCLAVGGVFDEPRQFRPNPFGEPIRVFEYEVRGKTITMAMPICQDVWGAHDEEHGAHEYERQPIRELAKTGVELLAVVNASPYWHGKRMVRKSMLESAVHATGAAIVYANYVGGHDRLCFDGGSTVMSPDGRVVGFGESFDEDIVVAHLLGETVPYQDDTHIDYLDRALDTVTRDYASRNGFDGAIVAVSGGADSALCAAAAAKIFGPSNVLGIAMPSPYSSEGSLTDALALRDTLGIPVVTIPIVDAYQVLRRTIAPLVGRHEPGTIDGDVTEENLQARIRGMVNMAVSNASLERRRNALAQILGQGVHVPHRPIVITTGNKSECSVGFATLYGDMAGGWAHISDVFKTDVFRLMRWYNVRASRSIIPKNSIEKPPSAELRPGQLDTQSLPPYDVLDAILRCYVEERCDCADIAVRTAAPIDVVRKVLQMCDRAQYKREQAAPGPLVSRYGLDGFNRRWPMTHAFQH